MIAYLRATLRARVLSTELSRCQLGIRLKEQYERWWSIDIDRFASKEHFLRYAGRYVRRPPIAQYRFTKITDREIQFWVKGYCASGCAGRYQWARESVPFIP